MTTRGTSGRDVSSGSARSASQGISRRNATVAAEHGEAAAGNSLGDRHHLEQQHEDLTVGNDDSFSEERFSSVIPSAASWESQQSFESSADERSRFGGRPGSRSNIRDRRKQFDTTTPTLIDEDELPEEEKGRVGEEQCHEEADEEEIISLGRLRGFSSGSVRSSESSMRRTPGASMYKSSVDPSSVRRTPGASAMHQSSSIEVLTPSQHDKDPAAAGLGFGLTLSTPVGSSSGEATDVHETRTKIWASASQSHGTAAVATRNDTSLQSREPDPVSRPPLAPGQQQHEPRGPFSFAPWLGPRGPTAAAASQVAGTGTPSSEGAQRHGAFSPNTLRLTEDIGNLLQEDEDDDYALEIPAVFRDSGNNKEAGSSDFDADWTGSYVFSDYERRIRPLVPRPNTGPKEERSRRKSGGGHQGNFFPNAQQPKPRRSGNEVFQFGQSRPPDHERPSTQLVNLGGAFAPPTSSLVRPAAAFGSGGDPVFGHHQHVSTPPPGRPADPSQRQQSPSLSVKTPIKGDAAGVTHSYQAAKGTSTHPFPASNEGYFQSSRFSSPSPTFAVGGVPQQQRQYQIQHRPSEMQATAREFVPMATRGTPVPSASVFSGPPQQWSQHPSTMGYEGAVVAAAAAASVPRTMEQGSWHAPNYAYGAGPNYAYGMPPPNQGVGGDPATRAGMTPPPHVPAWQPQAADPNIYAGHPISTQMEHRPPYMVSPGAHVAAAAAAASSGQSDHTTYRDAPSHRVKKETKRGKRGKKKSQKSEGSSGGAKKLLSSSKKKKQDILRPGSTTQSQDGTQGDDNVVSASDEPMNPKRAELEESPSTRIAFKDFYRSFRGEERLSFQKAEEFALHVLQAGSLPESVHWRVYLELADLAKRSNRYFEARRLYQKVCQLQPYASQGWLEYSKLEEECGHMNRVTNVLHAGLEYCQYSENLLTRAVKHQEKMGNVANARGLLARLKHVGIDKVWRTVLEGAMLEARVGNTTMARRVLKYLMHHVPWYGPLYLEAYRLERDQCRPFDALHIVERGLQAIPRYGPLWFGAFRLCEEMDLSKKLYHLPSTMGMIERAILNISKELVWKVHLEAAQMQERSALEKASNESKPEVDALFVPARNRFALTILTCPHNLRWKVWLAAARMELGLGNTDRARALFFRAHQVVPEKGRSATLLECARLEEFIGDTELARAVLCKGRVEYGHDWKVWLEGVLLETRGGNFIRAIEIVTNALEIHCGTGRLWAALVQLSQFCGGGAAQNTALRRALRAVPKSGEVWCEGGRIHLNPFCDTFDVDRARRHLSFATRFTPQFGDSFVETLRLELLCQWLQPVADFIWDTTKASFLPTRGAANEDRLTKYVTDVSLAVSVACQLKSDESYRHTLVHSEIVETVRKRLSEESMRKSTDLSGLRLACANADPNYGSLWIHCRRVPTDTPRKVIEDATKDVAVELRQHARVYLAAMIRRRAILATMDGERPPNMEGGVEIVDPVAVAWENRVDERLRAASSLKEIFNPLDPTTGSMLLERTISGPDFATGLSELNRHRTITSMSLSDRKKALFGTDALFP